MAESRVDARRRGAIALVLAAAGVLLALGLRPAVADVTAVSGDAFGYSLNVTLFGGTPNISGPAPTITLPAAGSATPLTATAPSANASAGPATFFVSGQLDVSTQGTTGPGGTTTTSTNIQGVTDAEGEQFSATTVSSTCTASETGVSGSTTIAGGMLHTDSGDDTAGDVHPAVTVPVPDNPAPNTSFDGHIHVNGSQDNFTYIFNEQIPNADGTLTVYAAHEKLLGPTAVGDLFIGKSQCGITATASGSTTTTAPGGPSTTTAPGGSTTTTAPGGSTTTVPATSTTVAAVTTTTTTPPPASPASPASPTTTAAAAPASGQVSGGAYGYFTSVGLFGGAPATRGPTPKVELPAGGSASPITASDPTGDARYGPAQIFSSDKLDVSTQGTPGGTVTSSANIANTNKSDSEVFAAATVHSTCTASSTGQAGSTQLTGGKLTVSKGANLDSAADDTVVQLPASPAANTSYDGKLEDVGDTFRVVLNEQQPSAGSITVNAMHMYLLGPTAKGDLIVGQVRCAITAAGASGTTGGSSGGSGSGGTTTSGTSGGLAGTGIEARRLTEAALVLVMMGWMATRWAARRRVPWPGRVPWLRRVPWPQSARRRR